MCHASRSFQLPRVEISHTFQKVSYYSLRTITPQAFAPYPATPPASPSLGHSFIKALNFSSCWLDIRISVSSRMDVTIFVEEAYFVIQIFGTKGECLNILRLFKLIFLKIS